MNATFEVQAETDSAKARLAIADRLVFGKVFADLMVRIKYDQPRGWHKAAIVPYEPIVISPAAKVLHYGQEIFEGLKAYVWPAGGAALFRPELNARRFNLSARLLAMPEVPEPLQLQAMDLLVTSLTNWIPRNPGAALYLRPMLIGTEPCLGVAPSSEYLYLVLASPVGPYFNADKTGICVWIEERAVRAFPGGVGAAKTGGNYASGLRAQQRAKQAGFDQVIYLDGFHHRYLEEMNGMNIFLVRQGVLLTPPLGDTVLDGITRKSILELAPQLGLQAQEQAMAIEDTIQELNSGLISEIFTAGTGAGITPIAQLGYRSKRLDVGSGGIGPLANKIKQTLTNIISGVEPDHQGWMRVINPS